MAGIAKIVSKDLDDIAKVSGVVVIGLGDAAVGDVKAAKTFYAGDTTLKTGTLATVALDPANDTVGAGYYAATTLHAVDADLAVGNIKSGVTIFGFLGTYAGGAITHDTLSSAVCTDASSVALGIYHAVLSTGAGADATFLTFDLTCAQATIIYAGAGGSRYIAQYANIIKLRLYIDGVQVAETDYITEANIFDSWVLVGYRSVSSGARTITVAVHNYDASARNVRITGGLGAGCAKLV